jgi:two-component system, cell cycle sensor histidine kinase and response regulator CckA
VVEDRSNSGKDEKQKKEAGKTPGQRPKKTGALDKPDQLARELELHRSELEGQIEELRRKNLELEEAKEKFLEIYDSAPVGCITLDEKGIISELNLTAAGLLGAERESLFNQPFYQYIKAEFRGQFGLHEEEVLKSAVQLTCELVMEKGDGSFFHAQVQSIRTKVNGLPATRNVLTDVSDRKRAEEALQASEERYRIVVANSADAIFLTQPDGNTCAANPAACRIFGRSEEELCRLGREAVIDPDDLRWPAAVVECRKSGLFRGELNYRRKDGTVFPGEVSSTIFRDSAGREWVSSVIRDITERRRAEERITKLNEVFLRFGADPVANINLLVSFCGEILGATTGLYNRLQGGMLCALGQWNTPSDFKTIDRPEGHLCHYVIQSNEDDVVIIRNLQDSPYAHTDPNVRRYDLQTYIGKAVKFGDTNIGSLCVIFQRDVVPADNDTRLMGIIASAIGVEEERRRAEEALRESEHKLQALMDAAPVAISWADTEGNRKYINRKFSELFGYSLEDIPTMAAWRLRAYPDLAYRSTIPNFLTSIADGKGFPFYESTVTCKDGSQRQVIGSAAVVSNMILLMLDDITERKHLESELRQAQKMEAIGHLAGGVAHDFNNILMAIIGFGTLIDMDLDAGSPHRAYVGEILRAAERAARLTDSLLAYSRKQMIRPVPLNLNDCVVVQKELLRRLIGEDIGLVTDLAKEPLVVMADQGQVDQVVMNIVTNARDAMPTGGTITIRTSLAAMNYPTASHGVLTRGAIDDASVASRVQDAPGAYALLAISDTGTGMDEEALAKIFDPFYTTKEVGKGTGLGLSVVYGIVKQHKGHVHVESIPGQGTTFLIYLPIIEEKTTRKGEERRRLPGGHETILLAEDEEVVRFLMKTVLEKSGYTVIEARNGTEALRTFMEDPKAVDMAVIDVVMPGMNGRQVYGGIKRVKREQKVLFISGYADDIIATKGVLEDGLDFIAKPIKPLDFLDKVRSILDS